MALTTSQEMQSKRVCVAGRFLSGCCYDMWSLGIVLILLGVIVFSLVGLTDPDFWWHLRTGQLVYESGHVPHTDPFSFTAYGKPWISHEWVAELIIYLLVSTVGYLGTLLLFGIMFVSAFWILYEYLDVLGTQPTIRLAVIALGSAGGMSFLTVRPRIFTILFFSIFLRKVLDYWERRSTSIWILPFLMLPWCNMHAGYIVGLVILFILWLAEVARPLMMKEEGRWEEVGVVLFLTLVASMVTPHGIKGLIYPFTYLSGHNPSLRLIQEWQSPNFHATYGIPLIICILISMGSALTWQKEDMFSFTLLAGVTAATLYSVRYMPLFCLTWVAVEGKWFAKQWPRKDKGPILVTRGQARRNCLTFVLVILMYGILLMHLYHRGRLQTFDLPRTDGKAYYPAAAVDWLEENRPHARLFNLYRWGGYLIYRLWPENKVFIDGRADVYGSGFVMAYYDAVSARPGWKSVLDKWRVDTVLIPPNMPLNSVLEMSPEWQKVFSTRHEVVWVHSAKGN